MSLWSMNDGSALTGTMTFTNGNASVSGSGTNFDPEVKVGDVIISAGGVKSRVKSITNDTTLTLTANFTGSTENGVAATVTRPPANFDSADPHIDDNVFGVTATEAEAGYDNVTTVAVDFEGSGHSTAPSVTIAAPTARTITQANIDETTNIFTVTNHNMRTGTKLTYTSNGTNIVTSAGTLADATAVFVVRIDDNTFKIASSLSNALAGTTLGISNDGNDSNSFVGDTATATAAISDGSVTGFTVTGVGSDYQSVPAVSVAAPAEKTFNAQSAVSTANDTITISSHPFITGDAVTYSDKSGTTLANLTDGGTFFVIKVDANTIKLATTEANAVDGTAIDLTAGSSENHGITGETTTAVADLGMGDGFVGVNTSSEVAHIGWVKKTVGTGGRAGRVHYETLVAASSMTGDGEDISTPDS